MDNEYLSLEEIKLKQLHYELDEWEFRRYLDEDEDDEDENEHEYEHVNTDYKIENIIIDLADKWLGDILSGESFYKNNKFYFTKNEIKIFFSCDWLNIYNISNNSNYIDLLKYYWEVKIKANELNGILSPEFCMYLFDDLTNENIQNYFRFICFNKRYIKNEYEIFNIWDSIKRIEIFNFYKMTWHQLKYNSDEWHKQQIDSPGYNPQKQWKKSDIKDYIFTTKENIWTIKEITTGKLLYDEGVEMHNCVFSYIEECIQGYCAIFSVKMGFERMATLEVRKYGSKYSLVQARELFNGDVKNQEMINIIKTWVKENNIIYNI